MDWLDPQQDVVRQGVQGGGGERGKIVRVGGGEQGVLVIVNIHRTFWWMTERQHVSHFTLSITRIFNLKQNCLSRTSSFS